MAIQSVKYYSGTIEVNCHLPMKNAVAAMCFPDVAVKRYDGYSRMVGYANYDTREILPITRVIEYKRNPSMHKCDARCTHAKGRQCECSCGGKFHGLQS